MTHEFLKSCQSEPLQLGELKPGDVFIFFPDDGDDSGHGGFKNGARVFVKIEPTWPGEPYHPDYRYNAKEYERPQIVASWPNHYLVIKLSGV